LLSVKTDGNKGKEALFLLFVLEIIMAGKAPIFTVRVGSIQFSVWENETAKGPMRSVTINKSYKDGETWKTTQSFKVQDMPLIELGLQEVMKFQYLKAVEEDI